MLIIVKVGPLRDLTIAEILPSFSYIHHSQELLYAHNFSLLVGKL